MILVNLWVVVGGINEIWGWALAMEGGVGASPSSAMVGGGHNERHHKVTSMSMSEYMIVCEFSYGGRELK